MPQVNPFALAHRAIESQGTVTVRWTSSRGDNIAAVMGPSHGNRAGSAASKVPPQSTDLDTDRSPKCPID